MDDIGLGKYLEHFGVTCVLVIFVATFLVAKYVAKLGISAAIILAIFVGALGYFASPYIYFAIFSLQGYSF